VNNTVGDIEVRCADLVIVQKIEVASTLEADVSQNPDSEYGLSPSSLPVTRKLDVTELGKLHQQRQSWHNYKGDSPSPETTLQRLSSTHKRKSKAHTWWCDEGDLSSGTLGDLDSSDTTARQSSVEDVDLTCSDVEDGPSIVRKKLSTWFGSFGKGNWKYRTRKSSNSQFYCDSQGKCDQRSREEEPAKEQIAVSVVTEGSAAEVPEIEVDGLNSTVGEGSRPSSGLSALSILSALDVNQRSDAAVSEGESFEVFQHSESDCEGEVNPEDRDANPSQLEEIHHDKKAFYIAKELMTSERVFIDALKLLNVDFRQSVQAAAAEQKCAVIPYADLDKILNSLPQLQRLNEDLLHDLETRINNWNSVKKIADVIVKKGPFLKLYTSYIQNFESQCIYLDECCQKYPKFGKVVKEFEGSPRCQRLSLKHFMLKPVQRIPQYRLLLEDYLCHLSETSPDRDNTHTALSIVRDVADHANRSIQLGDDFRQLLQLQSQLDNYEIIKPGRKFIKDGELFKLSRKGRQPRYFILLNDSLLYTSYYGSVPSSGLKVNYELPLSSIKVSIPRAEDYGNEFSIISVKRSFTLSARSLSERQEWVDALQKAIMDCTSRQLSFHNTKTTSSLKNEDSSKPFKLGQEAPVWIQDRRVTMCQSCTAEFTVTFRRHHCRACGKVVCSDCSDFRAPLQYINFQSARVCEECYETLFEEFKNPTSEVIQEIRRVLGKSVRIRDIFRRLGPVSGKKVKKYIPQRLKEVTANDTGAQMSGWLQRRTRRSWKRLWFVLKEQVLYVYRASEDVVALDSIPVLGYTVETMKERHFELYEGIDAKLVFQLAHRGQPPLIFHADGEHLANRWIAAMSEATILK
jgi:FYVE/RhoGEF/PH domain-containing protein 5/6